MLVGGVFIVHHMDKFADRDLRLDGVEETDELLMPVTLHAAPDHLAFEHIESGETAWLLPSCSNGLTRLAGGLRRRLRCRHEESEGTHKAARGIRRRCCRSTDPQRA